MELIQKAKQAKAAAAKLAMASTEEKNDALKTIAEELLANKDYLLTQNALDLEKGEKNGLSAA